MSLTKKDIRSNLSKETGFSAKKSNDFLNGFISILKKNVYQGSVKISRFGTFHLFKTKERYGRNPKTKEIYKISSFTKVKFNPSNKIKNFLN